MKLRHLLTGLIAASLALAGCSLSEDIAPPPNSNASVVGVAPVSADGAAIYAQHCVKCHGPAGKGDGPLAGQLMAQRTAPLPDFSDPAWRQTHTTPDLLQVVAEGRLDKLMPPFKDILSDSERQAVVAYIETLSPAAGVASSATLAPAGQAMAVSSPVASIAPTTAAQTAGLVSGQVVNSSRGAVVSAGQVVILTGYDNFSQALVLSTTTGADGGFAFSAVPYVAGRQFLVSTRYADLNYSSDLLNFEHGSAVNNVRLAVFDVTADPSVIKVEQMHISVSRAANTGMVDVAEMFLVSNSSDRVYVPATGPVLEVPLPTGATAINLDSQRQGLDLAEGAQAVRLNSAIRPGKNATQFSFSFHLPGALPLAFEQKLGYRVKALNVFVPNATMTVQGTQLSDAGVQTLPSGAQRAYAAQDLASGEVVSFQVRGLGGSGVNAWWAAMVGPALPIAALALVVVLGAGLYWQRRLWLPVNEPNRADALVQAIADLDDAHEAGQLDAQPYQHQRARLKQELAALLRRQTPQ